MHMTVLTLQTENWVVTTPVFSNCPVFVPLFSRGRMDTHLDKALLGIKAIQIMPIGVYPRRQVIDINHGTTFALSCAAGVCITLA